MQTVKDGMEAGSSWMTSVLEHIIFSIVDCCRSRPCRPYQRMAIIEPKEKDGESPAPADETNWSRTIRQAFHTAAAAYIFVAAYMEMSGHLTLFSAPGHHHSNTYEYLALESLEDPDGEGCFLFPATDAHNVTSCTEVQEDLAKKGGSRTLSQKWVKYGCAEDQVVLVGSFFGDRPFLTPDGSFLDFSRVELTAVVGLFFKTLSALLPDSGQAQQLDFLSTAAMAMQDKLSIDGGCFKYKDQFGRGIAELLTEVQTFNALEWMFLNMALFVKWTAEHLFNAFAPLPLRIWGENEPASWSPTCQADPACVQNCKERPDTCNGASYTFIKESLVLQCPKQRWIPGIFGCDGTAQKFGIIVLGIVMGVLTAASFYFTFGCAGSSRSSPDFAMIGVCGVLYLLPYSISMILFGVAYDPVKVLKNALTLLVMVLIIVSVLALFVMGIVAIALLVMLCLLVCFILSYLGLLEVIGLLPFYATVSHGLTAASTIKKINAVLQLWGGLEHLFLKGKYLCYLCSKPPRKPEDREDPRQDQAMECQFLLC